MSFGATHETEVKFAAEICARYASFDRVRFCTSGTEANIGALKIAQAITGRRRILALHGGYHGNVMNYLSSDAPLNIDRQDFLVGVLTTWTMLIDLSVSMPRIWLLLLSSQLWVVGVVLSAIQPF